LPKPSGDPVNGLFNSLRVPNRRLVLIHLDSETFACLAII
jgi:hypothetical protein